MQELHSFYNLDAKIVLENLETSVLGLTDEEVKKRQAEYGKNVFEESKKTSLVHTFFSQFLSPLIFILIFASLITIYLGEVIETWVIWSAILINVLFSTYQEYKAENTIEELRKFIKNKAIVKRGGVVVEIEAQDLTIGDIVVLQYGSRVPADIRILESTDLRTDEAILTGESLPVHKQNVVVTEQLITERKNYCFCGTLVTNGNGLGVVTHIGEHTEIGKIATSLNSTKKVLTPVQTAVKNISWYIFLIALVIVTFVFVLGVYRGEDIFEMLVLASAVAVGAVPEALPIALTVILSIGVLNISKKGGLIRKLAAAETLGSTTLILTDKTGTLTEGKLKLENIISYGPSEEEILVLAQNNFSVTANRSNKDKNKWEYSGNAFEVILSKIIDERNIVLPENRGRIISPFNSTNKYSVSEVGRKQIVLGAPDILVNQSDLDDENKERVLEQIDLLSTEGKRLVAVGEKESDGAKLSLVGVFVFSDLLRKNIKKSVEEIVGSGVKVKMITGDLPGTAKFIAQQVGISANDEEVLTGSQIEELLDDDLLKILPNIKIFARVTPEDKLRIGKLYQQLGEVVAMTGDGVNDAPSLKAMDIGVSLSSASEVAKSAADMILLKDNFKTIVDTIVVGHNIKKNIQKVFVYLMSNSLDEVFVVTGALIAGLALPLTALQIIWVNILTGTLPALAFAYDKNYKLQQVRGDGIFNFQVKFMALGIGTFSSLLLFVLYYLLVQNIPDLKLAQSIFFLCFASYILIIAYSFVDLEKYIWKYNPFANWRLNAGVLLGLLLIFATVYTKLGQETFSLVSVPIDYLWILLVWLVFNVWVVEFAKFVTKKLKY